MPPKKQAQAGGSKKAEQKKEKIIEDKTFGLKNKKGAKQQKFIKAITHQVKFGHQNPQQVAQSEAEKKLKKDDKKKELQELNELFKPVVAAQKISKDTMDNWDEKKLEVCKHFLEAIENNKYGWFWVCPGGGDNCMYRHALPPGFVLKKDKKKEEKEDEISLEDLIERERSALGPNVTKITLDSLLAWKKRKRQEKIDKLEQDMGRRKADFKAGKALVISGQEVFEFGPELVSDDDEEADDTCYKNKLSEASRGRAENGEQSDLEEDNKLDGQENGAIGAVPVDENLFTGEDLDELEEELNTLDLEE
ncbi:Zinc finger CCCH domain-containing protein 15 [Heterocephalus glaber]|uniref:Zinc finger CCCH domain-containing protein 15 n=1 Tax=Heterocephalus glaber TaxID=10181 RepID=G5B1M0_HETGA|nr:Zinc finger CCCH domain-containing protein 15 [Heterocephalus glaber]